MEIKKGVYIGTYKKKFKIDLIVWKLGVDHYGMGWDYMFKIDLIVWKSIALLSNTTRTLSLK